MTQQRQAVWRSPYVVYSLFIWLKLALLRYFLFSEISLKWWLLDLASVLIFTGLIEMVFRGRSKRTVFWLFNAFLSLVFFAAALYYSHFGSIVTYTAALELKQIMKISSSVKATIQPLNYLFFADFVLILLVRVAVGRQRIHMYSARRVNRIPLLIVTAAGLVVSAFFIKYDKGIVNELVRAEQLGFLNYEVSVAVNGIRDKNKTSFANVNQAGLVINDYENDYGYRPQAAAGQELQYFAAGKDKNLIVVQLEAFQNFPIHLKYNGSELTPVLNRLAEQSFYFPHIFQQIGQGNTSDAEFMSNTSIYPTGTIPMSTGYGDRNLPSLAKLLQSIGYEADTFHVNEVHFWDRDKLYPAIGFDHYYDKPNYNNDNFNSFGASDEELFRVGTEKLAELAAQNKPFYAQFITVSSHFPFTVPEQFRKMTIPDSLKGKQLGDYLLAINYTDYAMGTFIDRLKKAGLWDNTIFVAYGDHFGLQPDDNDPKEVSAALGITYHPVVSRFNIPLMIHIPGQTEGQVIEQTGGQLDILPTIANLLGISLADRNFVHFGQDLLNIQKTSFGMRYYMPTGSFFNNQIMFTPGKDFDDGTGVSLENLQDANAKPYRNDFDYIMTLMKMSDEYVKLLPKR
ncbi:LTA synthase family protein [Paenibacillus thalictri]|uniref:LTA synthase family protein n=1 Tax=Paenibacillus thalictri TaxID=2527873 RepID=A0A4Q9DW26_9BACL|nr:LTA synthase family protein [Paenibacillus thalictri]TBL81264.1 LTA synthase family protein [Paenibacillus thalictri]